MLREIEHSLVSERRQGSAPAAQDLVRSRQAEALALAWLLTGNRNLARDLAEAAFVKLFHDLSRLEPDADPRGRLLAHLARAFLHDTPTTPSASLSASPDKHGVESLRERTLAALGRLGNCERAALLLSDMCGVDPDVLHERADDTSATPLEPAREHIRESLNIAADNSLRPLLVEAGFDGPRADLWPLLEGQHRTIERREKRRGQLLTLGVLGAVILISSLSMATIFGPELITDDSAANDVPQVAAAVVDDRLTVPDEPPALPTPTPTPALSPVGDVPNTLLVQTWHNQRSNDPYTLLSAFDPAHNGLRPIHEGGLRVSGQTSHPARISPDGRQLVMLHQEWTDNEIHVKLTAFDSTTFEQQWESGVASFAAPAENSGPTFRLATTISSDRFYVAIIDENTARYATVLAYDRGDGMPRETRTVNLAPFEMGLDFRGNVFLYVSPDETYVTLALQVWSYTTQDSTSSYIYRLPLPSLSPNYRVVAQGYSDPQRTFGMWGANLTPDGDSLYSLANWRDEPPQVEFLNLESGVLTVVDLPLIEPDGYNFTPTTSIVSHDGRRLYVLEQTSGTVAIVNLAGQRLERSFPLDVGAFDSMFGIGPNRSSLGYAAELSPDGSRLYLNSGDANPNQGREQKPASGVWVIDTSQWRIVDYWPAQGRVNQIFATPGEASLLFASHYYENERSYQAVSRIGSRDGEVIEEPVAIPNLGENSNYTLLSMAHLYRDQYGRSPTVAGEEPGGPERFETLPRIEASATTDSVAAGIGTTVEVRVLDPASGDVLDTPRPDVRFNPGSTVTAILTRHDQPGQIIVLARIEEGVYRGSVTLPAHGRWSIDVLVSAWGEERAVTSNAGQIDVAPTFLGSDGRQYQFRVSVDPQEPALDEKTTVRLRLVDVESGVPLPDGVDLDVEQPAFDGSSIEGMPERIDVSFDAVPMGTSTGFRTALLYRVSPGVYEGTTSFWQPGPWNATIRFQPPGGRRFTIPAGTVEVGGP